MSGATERAKVKAMMFPVEDQKRLQEEWNKPAVLPMGKKKNMLLTLVVAKGGDGYSWNASVRIAHRGKRKLKPREIWLREERAEVERVLTGSLEGCGSQAENIDEWMEAEWSLHLIRKVNQTELSMILRPHLVGRG